MPAAPLIPISYLNTDPTAVPPFACVQFKGDNDITATKTQSVKVVKPDGTGPYGLDLGKGAATTGPQAYSQLCMPVSHTAWAYYLGATAPGPAWTTEIGPESGSWDLKNSGSGFLYAGYLDQANNRILVMQKPQGGGAQIVQFAITSVDCDAVTAWGTVEDVLCSGAEASIGDVVQLIDPLFFLNGNPALVTGRRGLAVKLSDDGMYGDCAYKILSTEDLGSNCG